MSNTVPNQINFKLHPDTRIAHVEYQVADLNRMVAFYSGLMGFQLIEQTDGIARISPTGQPPALITLIERKGARQQPERSTGLYHTAFRFPGRGPLATILLRIVASGWPLQGAADHRVSEAIYLPDPENNGIEIYRDRPRQEWPQLNGMVQMGNLPLDLHKLIEEADQAKAQTGVIDPGADIGHIHLQVSNTAAADAFYHGLLGFDVVMSMPSAIFLSAGGYHHHIGANTWNSLNAPRREDDMTGLRSHAYMIPDEASWLALLERLQAASQSLSSIERGNYPGVAVSDQDGNRVELLGPDTDPIRAALTKVSLAQHAA
jgi:catechol 2,3-dioxygenase